MAIRLTFVRHGATDWNRDRRFQGQTDVPLNDEGRAQAQALARALRDEHFDTIVSSDLVRAYATASEIAGERPIRMDLRWREFAFGEWEGLTWDEITHRWPSAARHGATLAKRYAPPGGEDFAGVRVRVGSALHDLRSSDYSSALIVTHAGPLHAALHEFFGDREAEMQEALGVRFSPASITRVEYSNDGAELISLNEVTHLFV